MTAADQMKILDRKNMQNEAQYDLYRKAAKISALSSNNFKYEYLTGQDLGLKPSTVEQTRFDYATLSKLLNKGLKEEEKKEGPLNNKKAIKDQGNIKLNAIKNINTGSKLSKMIDFFSGLSPDAKKLLNEIKEKKKMILILKNLFVQNMMLKFLTLTLSNSH